MPLAKINVIILQLFESAASNETGVELKELISTASRAIAKFNLRERDGSICLSSSSYKVKSNLLLLLGCILYAFYRQPIK